MTNYIDKQIALMIHTTVVDLYGGSHGVRDENGLDSALARPQSGYYKDIIEEAAALMESLIQNHPFIDGNKRTAFALPDTFLEMNGYEIRCDSITAYNMLLHWFDTKQVNFRTIDTWLRTVIIDLT